MTVFIAIVCVFVLLSVLMTLLSYIGKDRVAEILAHTMFMFSIALMLGLVVYLMTN